MSTKEPVTKKKTWLTKRL